MTLLMIGTTEILVIGGAILLIFGGKKIPELMRSMGQGVKNFKEGMKEEEENPSKQINDKENNNIEDK